MKLIRWVIFIAIGGLAGLWIAVLAVSRAPMLRTALVDALSRELNADVELADFEVRTFPLVRIHGDGLKLRLKDQRNPAPFIEVRHFEVSGGLFGMLRRTKRFRSVELEGLKITIPPRTTDDKAAGKKTADTVAGPVLIDRVVSTDALLIIVPKNPAKEPKVWSIHNLELESVGFNRSMPFTATLTNPIPKGEIATRGSFGPWASSDPGLTPVSGHYTFDHADLSTIDGIGGILGSTGDFTGALAQIDVKGKTSTPDFRLEIAGTPMPLETTFHTVVDGTNGDTYLKKVEARLGSTPIDASGAVVSQPGVKGRTVQLDLVIHDGRIEDMLRLAVKGKKPVMQGRLALQSSLLVPPGKRDVADKLELSGTFAVERAEFGDPGVTQQLETMSRRAQGKNPDEPIGKIASDMRGRFTLKDGHLRLDPVRFSVPGAEVQLVGGYGLRSEQVDFVGTFAMQASVSEAMGGGVKGFFLKPFNPIFRKDGKGAVLPITVRGPRSGPKFGLEWGKVLK